MNRQELAARVRALMAKTVDKGCTESEAMAAAAKAKELMDKYQLNMTDLELEEEGCEKAQTSKYKGGFNVQSRLALAIEQFCDVKCWSGRGTMIYYGLRSDTDFATWLTVALESFVWAQADAYQHQKRLNFEFTDWADRRSFVQGCTYRISERLEAAAAARKQNQAGSGRSLVVAKGAIVEREFKKLGI